MYDRLFFYAYKIVGDVVECEDLVQDTFIHYWENGGDRSDPIAVKVYLYTTLGLKIRNHLRKQNRRRRLIGEMPFDDSCFQEHTIISAEIAAQVRQAIQRLSPQTGRVLTLSLLDLSQEDIAARMNISVNTVKTIKKRGYKALCESLAHLKSLLPLLFLQ
jgi:RNA polymerase sigma-70 factor (ECF subfamily)